MDQALTSLPAEAQAAKLITLESTTLAVANMHCGACMRKVESTLNALPGVTSARVNLSAKRVMALHDPSKQNAVGLVDALQRAGYTAAELTPDVAVTANKEEQDFLRRIGVAGFAAANIMLLSVSVWASRGSDMSAPVQSLFHWLSALIALPAIAYAGVPFFRSAALAIAARSVNMDVPISLGVSLATLMSIYQSVRGTEQVYFDAAITLLFFLLIGRYLDQRMRVRAAGAAANLIGLTGTAASVLQSDGTIVRVSAKSIHPGMQVLTAAGERFVADGVLVQGAGQVDQSLLTGESAPVRVAPGTRIYAGTVNLTGPMVINTSAASDDTILAGIARLMAAAEQARGRYVRLADRAAKLYAPLVHTLSLITFIGWQYSGTGWQSALTAAIAVLIITCPCALALAVPAVQIAATSRLFAKGILVKAPDALERLAEVDTVAFDKTGTLTLGRPTLIEKAGDDIGVLAAAASLAANSRHPYARAVVAAAERRGLSIRPSSDVVEVAGSGLMQEHPDGSSRLGSAAWCGAEAGDNGASLWYRSPQGALVSWDFADEQRPKAAETIRQLRAANFQTEILSGDRAAVVSVVAESLGIERWKAQMLPADKIAQLKALANSGAKVLMVGDGLNDAPALASAHASMSPSTAADISQTTADVIFQGDSLTPVAETIAVARASQHIALQNFAIAIGYNLVFVPLAMAGHVTPLLAAIAMSASSLAVTANALRLRTKKVSLQ